ncbi:MAG: DUF59 domain-containing protein [Candidatus Aminicenantes bacterium]|nr:DUF59 domain-containing protein [Candidatus Aminicenantes bacterium]
MDKDVTVEDVRQAMANVKHPAIDCSLIELGMVKDINVKDKNVTFRFLLPFMEIPENIKEYMINNLSQSIINLGLNVEVKIDTMNEEERQYFLTMEEKNWKGL